MIECDRHIDDLFEMIIFMDDGSTMDADGPDDGVDASALMSSSPWSFRHEVMQIRSLLVVLGLLFSGVWQLQGCGEAETTEPQLEERSENRCDGMVESKNYRLRCRRNIQYITIYIYITITI